MFLLEKLIYYRDCIDSCITLEQAQNVIKRVIHDPSVSKYTSSILSFYVLVLFAEQLKDDKEFKKYDY